MAEAADPPSSGIPPSSLPWGQIPRFDPSTTDLRVYTQKLQFLHQVWPTEYIEHLAPRAALLVEGAAFQKLARLDAQKLRTADGVKILIETLGGAWGRTDPEDTYDLFERALYSVSQRSDETNDSYLARHDTVFEDLLSKKITLADVRAYVLVRQSNLSSEDRKRIIVDNQGQLTYEQARKSLRLLGSRFFQDLQGNRANQGKKTYETYQLDEHEDHHQAAFMQETETMEIDEEQIFQLLADQGDEDAVFISDFEDQIVDAIQDHPGLSQCFPSYQEARARVRERARARGFWPVKGKTKGKGGKKGKPSWTPATGSSWTPGRRRSLADRIANSTCRACGQPGHWKRECPNRPDVKKNEATNITEEIHLGTDDIAADIFEVVSELPEDAVSWNQAWNGSRNTCHESGEIWDCNVCVGGHMSNMVHNKLHARLIECCRKHGIETVAPVMHENVKPESVPDTRPRSPERISEPSMMEDHPETVFHVEEACHEAILDTGASRAVIGSERLNKLVSSCGLGGSLKTAPSNVNFRFGNSGVLQSSHAVFFPRKTGGWIRVEVVPGQTPFLLSNSVLRALKAVVDIEAKQVWFKGSDTVIPLRTCRKNLMSVDFAQILNLSCGSQKGDDHEIHVMDQHEGWNHENMCQTPCEVGDKTQEKSQVAMNQSESVQESFDNSLENVGDGLQPMSQRVAQLLPKFPSFQEAHPTEVISHESGSSRSATDLQDRSEAQHHSAVPRGGAGRDSASTGDLHYSRVGSAESALGEVWGKDIRTGTQRSMLCSTNVESEGSFCLGSKFSDVLQGPKPGHPRVCLEDAGAGDRSGFDQASVRGIEWGSQQSQCRAQADQQTQDPDHGDTGKGQGRRVDQDRRGDEVNERTKSSSKEGELQAEGISHGSGAESPSSSGDSHTDRDPGAGACQRDRDSRRGGHLSAELDKITNYIESECPIKSLSPQHEAMLHMAINRKINEVESGLLLLSSKKGFGHVKEGNHRNNHQSRPLDLLEVYCEPNSQITTQINKIGGRAMRFSKSDGDLNTSEGVQKFWLWIYMYEPRHVWLAPECRLYGKFSNLNMNQSLSMYDRIQEQRKHNKHHLHLCNDIYNHQVSHRRHVHLEQPSESCMFGQPELKELMSGTYEAKFDMCEVGKLKLPHVEKFLRKRTSLRTTNGYLYYHLHQQFCGKTHEHETIQGSFNHQGQRQNVSAYAAAYTSVFGSRIARLILEECQIKEPPCVSDVFVAKELHERPGTAPDEAPCPKRQRHSIKGPPRGSDIPAAAPKYGRAPTGETMIRKCSSRVPRVGNFVVRFGEDMFEEFQMMVPELQLKLVMLCRGTERFRVPGNLANGEPMPWRKTIIIDRATGEVIDKGPPENWSALSRIKQTRSAGSARMSITLFGDKINGGNGECSEGSTPEVSPWKSSRGWMFIVVRGVQNRVGLLGLFPKAVPILRVWSQDSSRT